MACSPRPRGKIPFLYCFHAAHSIQTMLSVPGRQGPDVHSLIQSSYSQTEKPIPEEPMQSIVEQSNAYHLSPTSTLDRTFIFQAATPYRAERS